MFKEARMERRYHSCGCPINVWPDCLQRTGEPAYFDGRTSWTECAIHTCPRCGERLRRTTLYPKPPVPTGILAAYLLTWPSVRQRLQGVIEEYRRRHPLFNSAGAQRDIDALENVLNRVAEWAARLDEPVPVHANKTEHAGTPH
jgi:hypothetical protein